MGQDKRQDVKEWWEEPKGKNTNRLLAVALCGWSILVVIGECYGKEGKWELRTRAEAFCLRREAVSGWLEIAGRGHVANHKMVLESSE